MNLILDTHAVLWAAEDPEQLGAQARAAILDPQNQRFFSAVTIWELAIKIGIGKLSLSRSFLEWTEEAMADLQATLLPISLQHAATVIQLPFHHRDPFDRLLIAQAQCDDAVLVSVDELFDRYDVRRIW